MVPVALVVYITSWTGWLRSTHGYYRDWAQNNPEAGWQWLPEGLRALVAYHQEAYKFHVGLTKPHDAQSNPLFWLLQQRPTLFLYESEATCSADSCSQAISALGNPLLWWLGIAALGVVIYNAVVWADRRAWAIFAGYAGGYLPWLFYAHRTIFTFYTVAFVPFVVLALVYAAGRIIGPPGLRGRSRGRRVAALTVALVLILVISAFFWPLWSGRSVPYEFWHLHMWLNSWI
jgi:dolichyl-phosphate-mannose--protein O-mannosyl transferase